jgi:acyl dehydratase
VIRANEVTLSAERFNGTFVHPFGTSAAWEAAVVEEELEQRQVIVAQSTTQEEVPTQPTVEVLDQ